MFSWPLAKFKNENAVHGQYKSAVSGHRKPAGHHKPAHRCSCAWHMRVWFVAQLQNPLLTSALWCQPLQSTMQCPHFQSARKCLPERPQVSALPEHRQCLLQCPLQGPAPHERPQVPAPSESPPEPAPPEGPPDVVDFPNNIWGSGAICPWPKWPGRRQRPRRPLDRHGRSSPLLRPGGLPCLHPGLASRAPPPPWWICYGVDAPVGRGG